MGSWGGESRDDENILRFWGWVSVGWCDVISDGGSRGVSDFVACLGLDSEVEVEVFGLFQVWEWFDLIVVQFLNFNFVALDNLLAQFLGL